MKLTPAMRQYMETKQEYPDYLLLFRMGDFYETFYEDAKIVSKVLDITLTARGKDETRAPLAGIPYHALDRYLGQLINAGYTVAICEQLEDPKLAKGVVKRGVTRIVTPGTIIEQELLDSRSSNFIAAIFGDKYYGYAAIDVSTGSCYVGECSAQEIEAVLATFGPRELLYGQAAEQIIHAFSLRHTVHTRMLPTYEFSLDAAQKIIRAQFSQHQQIAPLEYAQCALGALLSYIRKHKHTISHICTLTVNTQQEFLTLDEATIHNLELINSSSSKGGFSLLKTLDTTRTPMGARLLKYWLVHPLHDVTKINQRLNSVQLLLDTPLREEFTDILSSIADMERICAKINNDLVNPRELNALRTSLVHVQSLAAKRQTLPDGYLRELLTMPSFSAIIEKITATIAEEPPLVVREGGFIRTGFNEELDALRKLTKDSKFILSDIQLREQRASGISTLKVKYNQVFGYFIEVTSRFADKVPAHYQRKQTLANAERYVTDELKELEHKILSAQDKVNALEYEIFVALVQDLKGSIDDILAAAKAVAQVDVLCCFAHNTATYEYCIPVLNDNGSLVLEKSRHPVVERTVSQFISNDCIMTAEKYLHIITGPNMAGKSTYMRQVALCVLLAHCGCGVPASKATICLTDRIFTRIGARDDVAAGQSTFMVEMQETATILNNATSKSMVILDEIGRGTSTYDGLSIAYAVAEDLRARIKAKTLFATHYHVLTEMGNFPGVANYNVTVAVQKESIVFLHKVVPGGTDKSYGIHVARLAGVPAHVINAAQNVQGKLTRNDDLAQTLFKGQITDKDAQKTLFNLGDDHDAH